MSLLFLNKYSNILFFSWSVWVRNHRPVISFPELSAFAPAQSVYSYPDDADTKLVPAPV